MEMITIHPEKFELLLRNFNNNDLKTIFKFINVNSLPDSCKELLVMKGYTFLTKRFGAKFKRIALERQQAYDDSFEKVINETCQMLNDGGDPDPDSEVEFYVGFTTNKDSTEWIESDKFGFTSIKDLPDNTKSVTITFTQEFMDADYISDTNLISELTKTINNIHDYLDVDSCDLVGDDLIIDFRKKSSSNQILRKI